MAKRGLVEGEVLALRPVRLAEWSEGEPGTGKAEATGAAGAATADEAREPPSPAGPSALEGAADLASSVDEGPSDRTAESTHSATRVTIVRPMPPVRGLRGLLDRISALTGVRRLRLDERGSFLWRRIDGERTVEQLAADLRDEFGEAVEPAGKRVAFFLRSLDRERLVELRGPSGAPVKLGRS